MITSRSGCSCINLINWGGTCPDLSKVEMSGINVHDNSFAVDSGGSVYGIGARNEPDPYHSQSHWNPCKDWQFLNNTNGSNINTYIGPWDVTNFYFPNYSSKHSPTAFLNAGFETNGIPYWSIVTNTNPSSAGANNNSVGQDGSWYGFIDYLSSGDAKDLSGTLFDRRFL